MKTAGSILSSLFDEQFIKKAEGYSKLFDSWKDISLKNGIAAAADHCRIKDLDRGILLIETDHPGWKQILQAKQSKLLNDFRVRFPEQNICGISFMLGKNETFKAALKEETPASEIKTILVEPKQADNFYPPPCLDAIKDDEFKEALKKLGQTIEKKSRK